MLYLDDVIEKLMNLDDQTCPCEVGIPCPYRDETLEGEYCYRGSCLDGMVKQVRKMVKEGG